MTTKITITTGWTPVTVGDGSYVSVTQGLNGTLASDSVAYVTSAIPSTTKLSGSKVLVFINIDEVGADVVCDMFLELSPDGTNWSAHENTGQDYISVTTDIDPDADGYKVYLVDLSLFRSPYYRIGINSAGNALGTAIRFQMGYSYLI